jgi:nucleoid-associated protein YgaU
MTGSGRALLIVVLVVGGLSAFLAMRFLSETPVAESPRATAPVAASEPRAAPPAPAESRAEVARPAPQAAAAAPQGAAAPAPQPTRSAPQAATAPATASQAARTPPQPAAQNGTPAVAQAQPAVVPPDPPRFDVVRIGARGFAVVAGRASPGAEVALLAEGREIGRARADARGEWVILPAEPLGPGSRQFSLVARLGGSEVAGADSVVVVVPDAAPVVAEASRNEAAARLDEAQRNEAAARAAEAQRVAEAAARAEDARRATVAAAQAAEAARLAEVARQDAARQDAAREEAARAEAARLEAETRARLAAAAAAAETRRAEAAAEALRRAEAALPPVPAQPLAVLMPGLAAVPRILQGAAPQSGLALGQVDYDDAGAIRFAGTAAPNATVRVYVNNSHAGDAQADNQGRWTMQPREQIAVGRHTLRVDQIAAAGAVAARIEVPFQRESLPEGDVQPGRVIVQPGHNLWRLARAAYGRGVHFTVIHQANREHIRDPHRIFPGQVFAIPAAPAGPASAAAPAGPASAAASAQPAGARRQ